MTSQDTSKMASGARKKVFVGLSGGVDSATSAALLVRDGYDVVGVFIKVWQPDWIECTWKEDRRDAMRVAAHLGIPFVTLDLEKEYKKEVIDYMIAEDAAGKTPNPDVMCNQHVKFGAFYDWAMKQGAECVATGHYARIAERTGNTDYGIGNMNGHNANVSASSSIFHPSYSLLAGTDRNKDQSYFLWAIKKEQLEHILFPVGDIPKPEVRKLAQQFGLPNADKKDSQGLCFIGKVDVKEFLSRYIDSKQGNVLNAQGKIIGTHPGALFFTIGERHGFTITEKTPHDEPYYVVGKKLDDNTITVSMKKTDKELPGSHKEVTLNDCNWLGDIPKTGEILTARGRYRQALEKIEILSANSKTARARFAGDQDTLTPGQSLVFYDGEVCVGGGIIE